MKTLILAWWSWTRLWPLSRKLYPKQFIQLKEFDNISFFQKTIKRAVKISDISDIFIVTSKDYKFHCINQANEIWINLDESQILVEPCARNTLAAISLWMKYFWNDDIATILSADHIINNEELFIDKINKCKEKSKESLILFWVKPTSPHTWYWYINFNNTNNSNNSNTPYKVNEFKEKPNLEQAKEYLNKWYYWNAWIFMFSKNVFFNELKNNNPSFYNAFLKIDENIENFNQLPNISIDYWLFEKTKNIYVWLLNLYWNDLWSFDAFDEYFKTKWIKNENILEIKWKWNFALSDTQDKKISIVWTNDLIIIDTKDALLVSQKWESQNVKEIVSTYNKKWLDITELWKTVYRPWWNYTIIDSGKGFQTKRLTVLKWKKLSSQMHYHRSEHWVVVSWAAKVTIWEKEIILTKWESTFIPIKTLHRLENCWKQDLHIIESQIWDYLGEDDIVRFEDEFWRI